MTYPGEFIPTVLVRRHKAEPIYVPVCEYERTKGVLGVGVSSFVDQTVPKLERLEVHRKYKAVEVRTGKRKYYRLEEI